MAGGGDTVLLGVFCGWGVSVGIYPGWKPPTKADSGRHWGESDTAKELKDCARLSAA